MRHEKCAGDAVIQFAQHLSVAAFSLKGRACARNDCEGKRHQKSNTSFDLSNYSFATRKNHFPPCKVMSLSELPVVRPPELQAGKYQGPLLRQVHYKAQNLLGEMYQVGMGISQNYNEATKWHSLSAHQGYAIAQTNLGLLFGFGNGVPQDYKEAM